MASSFSISDLPEGQSISCIRDITMNKQPMISALKRLGGVQAGELPSNMAASGISGKGGVMALFSSHPPIEQRIEALAQQR